MSDPRAVMPQMTDYGVSADGWEPLPWSWAAERLSGYRNYWLVTATTSGRPHALPVWAVWDDDAHLLAFSCAPGSRKARNLRANPQVTVAGDDTIECLSLEGTATEMEVGTEAHDAWVDRYLEKYLPLEDSLTAEFLRANAFFEVRPERLFAVIERADEFSTRPTKWVFSDR